MKMGGIFQFLDINSIFLEIILIEWQLLPSKVADVSADSFGTARARGLVADRRSLMKTPFRFAGNETKAALVIVFPPEFKGLFNPEIHRLVGEVQEQIEGVYVTFALSSGNSPDLSASIAAARFVGCDSAVVVPVGPGDAVPFSDHSSKGDWLLTVSSVLPELDAPAFVEAYREAVSEAERAA
jgi:hypothetical protein